MEAHLIDALGGKKVVAEALGISPNAVANWMLPSRAIPWRHRHVLARMAATQGVPLPEGYWGEKVA